MANRLRYFLSSCILCFILLVPVSAFQGSMSVTGNLILGDRACITCKWQLKPSETIILIAVRSRVGTGMPQQNYFQISFQGDYTNGEQFHNRLSLAVNMLNNTATMTIVDLQCSDDKDYVCAYNYSSRPFSSQSSERTMHLTIEAFSGAPNFTLTPLKTLTLIKRIWIVENTSVTAVCKADLHCFGTRSIRWRLFRQCIFEDIPEDDPRIMKPDKISLGAGGSSYMEQTFVMHLTMGDQDLIIACFVSNNNLPQSLSYIDCQNSSTRLCSKSEPIWVVPTDMGEFAGLYSLTDTVERLAAMDVIFGIFVGFTFGAALATAWYHLSSSLRNSVTDSFDE